MPKISVLIPTYNCALYLSEAIESVLAQTFKDFEIIVVDNNSTDNTYEVVSKYLEISNFFYFKNETNLGMGGNWNSALQFAKGKYIKFVCADDKLHPENLEKLSDILENDPYVTLVASYFQNFGANHAVIKHPFKYKISGSEILKYNLLQYNSIGTPTQVMFRKSSLWVGTFRTELVWILDGDMWHRLLNIGDYYCIPEVLSFIRCHDEQATVNVSKSFTTYFDEYAYLKSLQLMNGLNVRSYGDQLDAALERRVLNIIDKVPRMLINRRFDLIRKAFLYAYYEKMIIFSLYKLMEGSSKSIFRRIRLNKK